MSNFDLFTNPPLTAENMDLYVIRKGIFKALEEASKAFTGRFLDVGSGREPYRAWLEVNRPGVREYVGLDLEGSKRYNEATHIWDGVVMPFEDGQFDCAMATEVLEHCPKPEVTLSEVHRVLKPGGLFFFTVPFVWPLHDCPYDEYRYTPWSLERHLGVSGFTDIKVFPTGGWDATLAQVMGLWVKRSPMSVRRRKWLMRILFPFYKHLVRVDAPVQTFNHKPYLMPGIAGVARRSEKA
jgi:SAM-dependent methyltransferase